MKYLSKMNEDKELLEKIVVYYACINSGDGSVYLAWFLTSDAATLANESQERGCGSDIGEAETFVGSNIHQEALDRLNYPEDYRL